MPAPVALPQIRSPAGSSDPGAPILSLPNELILQILDHLSGHDLARISQTCRILAELASTPHLWARLVRNLRLSSPAPYGSFRELYIALHPHLWLCPRIFHSDRMFSGELLFSRYSSETGAITLHTVAITRSTTQQSRWSIDPSITISSFTPEVTLWHIPVLTLTSAIRPSRETGTVTSASTSEIVITLVRALAVPLHQQVPHISLWPPRIIPAAHRARHVTPTSSYTATGEFPTPETASPDIFRLRKTIHLRFHHFGFGAEVETYSAVNPDLYTPTAEHPLRGIWVGDYSAHGVETLLFLQRDKRLDAIKLTGDINVPRGEISFQVEDLGAVVRIAGEHEREWPGAKVISGRGQIAEREFRNASFIECELIWKNNDAIALHWIFKTDIVDTTVHHVSWFKRVDVERFFHGDCVQRFE